MSSASGGERAINIVTKRAGQQQRSDAVHIYLAQVQNHLDRRTGLIQDRLTVTKEIRGVVELSEGSQHARQFLVFPEVSIPFDYLSGFVGESLLHQPRRIVVAGIELASVREYRELIRDLPLEEDNRRMMTSALRGMDGAKLVNAVLIGFGYQKKQPLIYLQPKLMPSVHEASVDFTKVPVEGHTVYIFSLGSFAFSSIICSDIFNRPSGVHYRVVDKLNWDLVKGGASYSGRPARLKLFFNIQYNPQPESPLFYDALARLYDSGIPGYAEELMTFFVNTAFGDSHGGGSKLITHQTQPILEIVSKLDRSGDARLVDAPIAGLEFRRGARVVKVVIDRLPPWEMSERAPPIHLEEWKRIGEQWAHESPAIQAIGPIAHPPDLTTKSYEELAQQLSTVGQFRDAIVSAEVALQEYRGSGRAQRRLSAVRLIHFIGTQERHRGRYREALERYEEASRILDGIAVETTEKRLLAGRVEGARILVSQYLLDGLCRQAAEGYENLVRELSGVLATRLSNEQRRNYEIHRLHGRRHRAEMLRLLGSYREAAAEFGDIATAYRAYRNLREEAYAVLGYAECHRMLGALDEAQKEYGVAEEIAVSLGDERLLARLARNRAELFRVIGVTGGSEEAFSECMAQLEVLRAKSNSAEYSWGEIYGELTAGGLEILGDRERAKEHFEKALKLANIARVFIEVGHANLGLAEATGFKSKRGRQALRLAKKIYDRSEVSWGRKRVAIALGEADGGGAQATFPDDEPMAILEERPLFLNIP